MSEELSREKEITRLERKLRKDGQHSFVDEVRAMPKSALDDTMLRMAKARQDIVTAQKNDEKLKEAKAEVSSLNAPYNEAKRKNDEKARFISLITKDKYEE